MHVLYQWNIYVYALESIDECIKRKETEKGKKKKENIYNNGASP